MMFSYRKIGGLHFVKIGRLTFSCCISRRNKAPKLRKVRMLRATMSSLPIAVTLQGDPAFERLNPDSQYAVNAAIQRLEAALAAL